MSLFICWSGDRSYKLAVAVRTLVTQTVEGIEKKDIFVSDRIEKGANWFDSILGELSRAHAGIVCLTAENLDGVWLHFEAGALARDLATLSRRNPRTRRLRPPMPRLPFIGSFRCFTASAAASCEVRSPRIRRR